MKRFISFVIMMAMVIGLLPTVRAAENSERWQEVAWQCEELGLEITWYPEREGLMRRYGTDRMLLVQEDKSWLYSLKGDQPLAGPFDAFDYFGPNGLAPACQNWNWGIVDLSGQTVVDFLYASKEEAEAQLAVKTVIADTYSGTYAPTRADGSIVEGNYRLFQEETPFVNGVTRAKMEWGDFMYVNSAGQQVYLYSCGPQSQDFTADGYAVIYEENRGYNLIDARGKKLLPKSLWAQLRQAPWDAGFGVWGYMDRDGIAFFNVKTGEHITEKRFTNAFDTGKGSWPGGYKFNADGIMSVVLYEDGELRYKLMDTRGNLTDVERGENGLPVAPSTGKTYLPADGPEATGEWADLHEGLVWVNSRGEQTGKGYDVGLPWGFMDRKGELVVPTLFDTVGHFDYGYATVMVDGVYGLLKNPLDKKEAQPSEPKPEAPAFTDVPAGIWYEQGVKTCARNGVMVGTGENAFSPDATLTDAECAMLAYRIYAQANGGDGSLLKMPEDWNYLKLVSADGTFVYEGYAGDPSVWTMPNIYYSSTGYRLCPVGAGEIPFGPATLTLRGREYPGAIERVCRGSGKYESDWFTVFQPEDGTLNDLLLDAERTTPPGHWWADMVYTIWQKGWEGIFPYTTYGREASRGDFAEILGSVTTLPKKFDVPPIPDGQRRGYNERYDCILDLYEAGVIGGVDAYGTFEPDKTLTRAEAAVMVARILDESQRLTAPPKPMPKEGERYTLTYLMDGEIDFGLDQHDYPYYFVEDPTLDWPQRHKGVLKLDGTFTPWPESDTFFTLDWFGGDTFYWTNIYEPETEGGYQRYEQGVLNDNMEWVIRPQYVSIWPRDGGFAAITHEDRYLLLDEKGDIEKEVASPEELPDHPGYNGPWEGWQNWSGLEIEDEYSSLGWRPYYRWPDGRPATEKFDRCGRIGPDGRGFVQRDGKLYRIQFTPRTE